jgi:hypothetical protein
MGHDSNRRRESRAGLSRRGFLAGTMAAPQIAVLGKDGQTAPSERITNGMLGVGNRGSSSLSAMYPLSEHQVVAIADCRRDRAVRAQQQVNGVYAQRLGQATYPGCQIYNDFRELLARDDIDAVWGCVPDHWHGVVYSRAIEAGKDIYGEKPVTRYIAQGIKVHDAVRRYGCVFQTGTQQRSQPQFRQACELARNGYLGKVHTVEVGAPGGTSYPAEPPCDPSEGFDYDMWTGPAPYLPFDKKRCEWLAMYMISHYCAGFITNWGVHHLDIAGWGCPDVFEKAFEIQGTGVLPATGMTDTWISWKMQLVWASGLKMNSWGQRIGPRVLVRKTRGLSSGSRRIVGRRFETAWLGLAQEADALGDDGPGSPAGADANRVYRQWKTPEPRSGGVPVVVP